MTEPQLQKRCIHFSGADTDDRDAESNPEHNGTFADEGASAAAARKRARFVSDLAPEATLLNRPAPKPDAKRSNDDIGVWVDRNTWDSLLKQKTDGEGSVDGAILTTNSGFRHGQRPHSAVLGPLIDLYFRKVHPILPLLDEDEFRRNHAGGIVPEPLVHAMCLVAAKDPEAEPHLKLSDAPSTVPPRQFCSILYRSVTGALRVPVRFEKITLIRILALTSLHHEGVDGAEEASLWLMQAMHHGQTLGIHLGQQATTPAGHDLLMKRIFWCLWWLDRVSAATNGRPIIMSDVDIAIEPFAAGASGFPAFEVWLKITQILNQVIDFYRPTNDTHDSGWEGDYPVLEEFIDEVGGWELSQSLLATIHLFYLIVGILSHRTRGVKELPQEKGSQIRQRLYAIEVIRLMTDSKAPVLHPLPILPYAVSLALSVSYQFLRQAQMTHQQIDARRDFRSCVTVLQTLRKTWSSADLMTTLGKKVLNELESAEDLASFRIRRAKHLPRDEKDLIPPPTACAHGIGAQSGLSGEHGVVEPQQQQQITNGGNNDVDAVQQFQEIAAPAQHGGINLFDNMDDVFGTFMDPNYPLNLDDLSFVDDLTPFDWNAEVSMPS